MSAHAATAGEEGWPLLEAAAARLAPDAPEAAARGRAALRAVLEPLRNSAWPEEAWRFSDLTPGGFPAELVWRPRRPGLFWTAEAAAPEMAAEERLGAALKRLAALGAPSLPPDSLDLARRAAAQAREKHSIWIGGRHEAEGDRYKLYLGTPETAEAIMPRAGRWRPASTAGLRLCLLGLDAEGKAELYWRRRRYEPGDLTTLGRTTDLAMAGARLRAGLAALCGRDPERALEGRRLTFSLQLAPDGEPVALSLFCALPCTALGPVARVLEWLEAQAARGGAPAPGALWRRGMLWPSWLCAAATAEGLTWHAGLLVRPPPGEAGTA